MNRDKIGIQIIQKYLLAMPISFVNERYNQEKERLESETQQLLRQRERIRVESQSNARKVQSIGIADHPHQIPPSRPFSSHPVQISPQGTMGNSQAPVNVREIRSRIFQIIDVCKQQNSLTESELQQVIAYEQQILQLLKQQEQKQKLTGFYDPSNPEQREPSRNGSQVNQQRQRSSRSYSLNDNVIVMIEEIERKALLEIENLRSDKIELLKRLNQEITGFNELQQYTTKLETARGQQANFNEQTFQRENMYQQQTSQRENQQQPFQLANQQQAPFFNQSEQELKSKVALYENQLSQQNRVIEDLRRELLSSSQQVRVPGIDELYHQGESLRHDTLHLLKLKASNDDQKLRHLEERLFHQEAEKESFLKEINRFKQKFMELERDNMRLKQGSHKNIPSHSNISPYNNLASHKNMSPYSGHEALSKSQLSSTPIGQYAKNAKGNNLTAYEQTIAEMKSVVNN